MLGKLLKYEFKSTRRLFLPLFGAVLAMAVATWLLGYLPAQNNPLLRMPQALAMMLYVLLIVATLAVAFVVTIMRFYRNLLGDEGYLMMTLPVSVDAHIFGKLIAGVVWMLCAALISLVSLFFLVMISTPGGLAELFTKILPEFFAHYGYGAAWFLLEILLALVIVVAGSFMQFYAAMAIGPNLIQNRLLGSFLAYLIIYVALQVLNSVLMFGAVALITGAMGETGIHSWLAALPNDPGAMMRYVAAMIGGASGLVLLESAGLYFLTRHMLGKRLNLA